MKTMYIITGASGHLASTIIKYLKDTDCAIRGLILPSESGEDSEQIKYYKGDVTDIRSMDAIFSDTEGYEVIVIHSAGIISISSKVTQLLYNVNVKGTKNVIAQCKKNKVKRLLYISSVEALPVPDRISVIEEVSSFSPDSVEGAYAKTKAEASQSVLDAAKDGLDVVIVHPSGIVGPYDQGNNHLVQLVQNYMNGKLPAGITGGFDFVDVRDVAQGCISAANKGRKGECYILSNRYCTVKELLEFMRVATNGHKKICFPIGLAKAFAPVFEGVAKITHKRPLFTRYSLNTMDSNGHYSHNKATAEFGYCPRDLKDTIADTVLWLKNPNDPVFSEMSAVA